MSPSQTRDPSSMGHWRRHTVIADTAPSNWNRFTGLQPTFLAIFNPIRAPAPRCLFSPSTEVAVHVVRSGLRPFRRWCLCVHKADWYKEKVLCFLQECPVLLVPVSETEIRKWWPAAVYHQSNVVWYMIVFLLHLHIPRRVHHGKLVNDEDDTLYHQPHPSLFHVL
jgi:hypothetical protein